MLENGVLSNFNPLAGVPGASCRQAEVAKCFPDDTLVQSSVAVNAARDQNGEFGFDTLIKKTFVDAPAHSAGGSGAGGSVLFMLIMLIKPPRIGRFGVFDCGPQGGGPSMPDCGVAVNQTQSA